MIENTLMKPAYVKNCTRRQFVKDVITGLGTIAIGTFTLQVLTSCSTSNPTGPSNGNDDSVSLTIDIALTENQALGVVGGTIALASNDLDDAGIFVIRKSESEVIAFSRECTHQGCTVNAFFGNNATCGCHGSMYNKSGEVVNGSATKSLKEYAVTLSGNIVTIY